MKSILFWRFVSGIFFMVLAQATALANTSPHTPSEITIRVRMEQSGQALPLKVGDKFAVELIGVPTAGYQWLVTRLPDFVVLEKTLSGPTSSKQNHNAFVGGNHWTVFILGVKSAGEGTLRFEQRRAWESDVPALTAFQITVQVK